MRFLADTHLLLWFALEPEKLSEEAARLMSDWGKEVYFSAASIWEVAIKAGKGRADFTADAEALRLGFGGQGFLELAVSVRHAAAVSTLPKLHGDPFDRLLLAQAALEKMVFLTGDAVLAQYPGQVRLV